MQIPGFLLKAQRWLKGTPERSLDQAYEAALMIEAIEKEYFGGNPISARYGNYGDSAQAYFQGELNKYLQIINVRMTEFRASSTVLRVSDPKIMEIQVPLADEDNGSVGNGLAIDVIDKPAIFFRKLRFVDEVLARYRNLDRTPEKIITLSESQSQTLAAISSSQAKPSATDTNGSVASIKTNVGDEEGTKQVAGLSDRANVLPRSILRTVDRIRQDLDPNAEQQVVSNFRSSKAKTTLAIRFLLLLVIVPLLTQQFTKNFIVGPMVDAVRDRTEAEVFLNIEMEEEALHELQQFEERLRFEVLIGKVAPIPEVEIEQTVREKATEIETAYRQRSADAVKNVFADMFAAAAFALLLVWRKREVNTLKGFIDEIIYGLSDSAKAFIIILFTDMFVGFHSPHGWEVLLEGLSRHLGFPANREFIFLFIATFPVILDTVFKYWIFRYLNRISPSAVATYRNMNE